MSNTKVKMKKPSKAEINKVLNDGLILVEKSKSITDVITRDLHHVDSNNETQLTKKFDNIMNTDKDDKIKGEKLQELLEVRKQLKKFIKTQIQTLIKEKPTQLAILQDNHKVMTATLKRVNKPMIENADGKYVDSFDVNDLGKYRLVRMKKEQKAETLQERLLKWMRSEKKEGLFNGTKADSNNLDMYDFESLKAVIEGIERNGL